MKKRGITHEELKLIACITMLIDHIGAVFFCGQFFRVIGRISFPIFCFLIAEGAAHTRNPGKYVMRIFLSALISEVPFDLLFYESVTLRHQNVLFTLFLGLIMIIWTRRTRYKICPILICALLAELFCTDFGACGVLLIGVFSFADRCPHRRPVQLLAMTLIFLAMPGASIEINGTYVGLQMFGLLSLIPISLYHGQKRMKNNGIALFFYLFYPAHMVILLFIHKM